MDDIYLVVTYRHGKPFAAYLHFPRRPDEKSYRSKRVEPGLVIDFNRKGKPLGVEITAPSVITLRALNRVLRDLGLPTLKRADLAPLLAA